MNSLSPARRYDRKILEFVAHYRFVTSNQVLKRFFTMLGRSAGYGERVVLRLVGAGYLHSTRLTPALGRASRDVLKLTRAGSTHIDLPWRWDWAREPQPYLREFLLQTTEVMVAREAEGWRLVAPHEVPGIVREWVTAPYRHRRLNDTEAVVRVRLERQQIDAIPFEVLVHKNGDVRFLVPVRPAYSIDTRLARMPVVGLWPEIQIELVCSDVNRLEKAVESLEKWARRARAKVRMHRVEHHRTSQPARKKAAPKE